MARTFADDPKFHLLSAVEKEYFVRAQTAAESILAALAASTDPQERIDILASMLVMLALMSTATAQDRIETQRLTAITDVVLMAPGSKRQDN